MAGLPQDTVEYLFRHMSIIEVKRAQCWKELYPFSLTTHWRTLPNVAFTAPFYPAAGVIRLDSHFFRHVSRNA
ncbi:hypothetical protein J2X69_003846 [Algoriphagus sp. 4150]|nr:hypothetical protein [Algoriphagus sp. 4150]